MWKSRETTLANPMDRGMSKSTEESGLDPISAPANGVGGNREDEDEDEAQSGESHADSDAESEDGGPIESANSGAAVNDEDDDESLESFKKYTAYTVKLPADQLSALQSIWLELKRKYGTHSPDKSGMIEAAISAWLQRWEGPEQDKMLKELLEIRKYTRKRQYKKGR